MSAAVTKIEKSGFSVWTYTYTGTPPFRIYLNGHLLPYPSDESPVIAGVTTSRYSYTIEAGDGNEPPALEILDSIDTVSQNVLYPPRAILHWLGDTNAAYYIVYHYVGSSWVQHGTHIIEDGRGYYTFESNAIDITESHSWKVISYTIDGEAGNERPFLIDPARMPLAPSVTMTYARQDLHPDHWIPGPTPYHGHITWSLYV